MEVAHVLTALEERVRRLLVALARIAAERDRLAEEVRRGRKRVAEMEEQGKRWEQERRALGQRLEHLLGELDTLSTADHEAMEQQHELTDRCG
jgi:chromosome segregation ATPase